MNLLRRKSGERLEGLSYTLLTVSPVICGVALALAYLAARYFLSAFNLPQTSANTVDHLLIGLFASGFISLIVLLLSVGCISTAILYFADYLESHTLGTLGAVGIYLGLFALCAFEFFTGSLNVLLVNSLLPATDPIELR